MLEKRVFLTWYEMNTRDEGGGKSKKALSCV